MNQSSLSLHDNLAQANFSKCLNNTVDSDLESTVNINRANHYIKVWKGKTFSLELDKKTLIMGILNVTPDSFSDGGKFLDPQKAVRQAIDLLKAGADIIDIGGESTRPGSKPISAEQELARILSIIKILKEKLPPIIISVDTWKSQVAEAVLTSGADIINDIYALQGDPKMATTIAKFDAGLILMNHPAYYRPDHIESHAFPVRDTLTPVDQNLKQTIAQYDNIVDKQALFLNYSIQLARSADIKDENIMLDPGLGFGLTQDENYQLLNSLQTLRSSGLPVLSAPSRKRFIKNCLHLADNDYVYNNYGTKDIVELTEKGTVAAVILSIAQKANMVRIHDVSYHLPFIKMADGIVYKNN